MPLSNPFAEQLLKCSLRSACKKLTVKAPTTPHGHTQVEMTDMGVSTILITTEGRAEVAQHHFVFCRLGPVSSSLGLDPWNGVLLYSVGS